MFKNKRVVAIIPARSGSKGLIDKNIKVLAGKPLIAHTIDAALKSNCFDEIVVSTDSEKYAEIAKSFGAHVPFLRSSKNSSDKASTWDAVKEVVDNLNDKFDLIVVLQVTSPLRTSNDIVNALDFFLEKDALTVASVCETEHSAFWCNQLSESCSMHNFVLTKYQVPRQQLPKTYTLNGAIYILSADQLDHVDFYSERSYAFIMDRSHSVDIDDAMDFKYAELLFAEKNKS